MVKVDFKAIGLIPAAHLNDLGEKIYSKKKQQVKKKNKRFQTIQ